MKSLKLLLGILVLGLPIAQASELDHDPAAIARPEGMPAAMVIRESEDGKVEVFALAEMEKITNGEDAIAVNETLAEVAPMMTAEVARLEPGQKTASELDASGAGATQAYVWFYYNPYYAPTVVNPNYTPYYNPYYSPYYSPAVSSYYYTPYAFTYYSGYNAYAYYPSYASAYGPYNYTYYYYWY